MDDTFKLYAVRDKATGKLINNLTKPTHKFWEHRKRAENAIAKCKYKKDNFEVVEIECIIRTK